MDISTVLLVAIVLIVPNLILIALSIENLFLAQKFNEELDFYINRGYKFLKYSRIASILSIVLIALDLIMGS